tara:strand:+ start:288 stop:719 length:432 start_codon:yes stop_codon:yes gene_type:complete
MEPITKHYLKIKTMKKLLSLLIIPLLSFGQQELELRPNEKIIMEDQWSLLRPVYGKGKLLLQPGNSYLTTERFYFTTVKKALATKHFVKSFEYSDIACVRRIKYEKKSGYRIILKNGKRHTFTIGKIGLRRVWIKKLRSYIKN